MRHSTNIIGMLYVPYTTFLRPSRLSPWRYVHGVTHLNAQSLYDEGVRAVVFDKDNTLTIPRTLTIPSTIRETLEEFKQVFGKNLLVFSNTAGGRDDKGGTLARMFEARIGVKVLQHGTKKPLGLTQIQDYFRLPSEQILYVGDTLFLDVAPANAHGFKTVLVDPLFRSDSFLERRLYNYETLIKKIRQ